MLRKYLIILATLMSVGILIYSESLVPRVEVIFKPTYAREKKLSHGPDDQRPYRDCQYITIRTRKNNLELIPFKATVFLPSIVFPEIDIGGYGIGETPQPKPYELYDGDVLMPDNFNDKLVKFVNETYNKETLSEAELQFFKIFAKMVYGNIRVCQFSLYSRNPDDIENMEMQKLVREGREIIKDNMIKLNQLISNTITTNKASNQPPDLRFLSLMHLAKGFSQGCLDEFEDAIKTYDKIIGYNVDDYALTAAFYKARCIGAIAALSNKESKIDPDDYYKGWHRIPPLNTAVTNDNMISERYISQLKTLNSYEEADKIYREALTRYKHLEKDRKIIFRWMKEILAGKPLPESEIQPETDKKSSGK